MTKNKYRRQVNAFDRLSSQIESRRLSSEFTLKMEALSETEKEIAVSSYWDRKHKELEHLGKKIG